ncbi:hypothetical protein OYT1_ch1611 [Ferriphaselus amnicola]|uniref:Uncharacterized protein n=1 Tax=Ferriphaselus amnicola TaxID=1188319 RepID=A0A2Z6GCC4_9PROT|nr:hypothetical protein [Ferriphaselus amnicola]BBE51158.1 hypothetical protein OYT1_ch1611 [Ferriphaselus amnicola]
MKKQRTSSATLSRVPNYGGSNARILISLKPEEREALIRQAALEQRTFSSMARMFILRGMKSDIPSTDSGDSHE